MDHNRQEETINVQNKILLIEANVFSKGAAS